MQIIPLHTTDADFSFVHQLWLDAFPESERRPESMQRNVTDCNPLFYNCLLQESRQRVGLLTYWRLSHFCYVEHFAIAPHLRGTGMGGCTIDTFLAAVRQSVVLEVELPETPEATRRIAFYQRHGFALWPNDYAQPPYAENLPSLPLHLMAHGTLSPVQDFEMVRRAIYKHIYGVQSPSDTSL